MEELQEMNENSMLKIRAEIANRTSKEKMCEHLIEDIIKLLPHQIKKFNSDPNSHNIDEILRRISLLNNPAFIIRCVRLAYAIVTQTNAKVSRSELMVRVTGIMIRDLSIIPGFEPIQCVLVKHKLAEYISKIVTTIKDEHVKRIEDEKLRKSRKSISKYEGILAKSVDDDKFNCAKPMVGFVEPTKSIEEGTKKHEKLRVGFSASTEIAEKTTVAYKEETITFSTRKYAKIVRKQIFY